MDCSIDNRLLECNVDDLENVLLALLTRPIRLEVLALALLKEGMAKPVSCSSSSCSAVAFVTMASSSRAAWRWAESSAISLVSSLAAGRHWRLERSRLAQQTAKRLRRHGRVRCVTAGPVRAMESNERGRKTSKLGNGLEGW